MVEELRGLAGVFAGDAVGGAEDAQRAEGDVFEVADGRGDEIEAGCEGGVVRGRGMHLRCQRNSASGHANCRGGSNEIQRSFAFGCWMTAQ